MALPVYLRNEKLKRDLDLTEVPYVEPNSGRKAKYENFTRMFSIITQEYLDFEENDAKAKKEKGDGGFLGAGVQGKSLTASLGAVPANRVRSLCMTFLTGLHILQLGVDMHL